MPACSAVRHCAVISFTCAFSETASASRFRASRMPSPGDSAMRYVTSSSVWPRSSRGWVAARSAIRRKMFSWAGSETAMSARCRHSSTSFGPDASAIACRAMTVR